MDYETYKRRDRDVSESTLNSRISALKRFEREANITGQPEPEDVERWIDHLLDLEEQNEISRGTIRQYYKAVKYYFEKVKGDSSSIEHIRDWIPSGGVDHGDYLERDELQSMRLYAFSQKEKVILEMMYRYARRPSELIKLNMKDIKLTDYDDGDVCPECEAGTLKIVSEEHKRLICDFCEHEEADSIRFPILKKDEPFRATFYMLFSVRDPLITYIDQYRSDITVEEDEEEEVRPLFTTSHGRISYDTVYNSIKDIADRARIDKNITPKSLRHSRATHLDWDGEEPGVIARHQLLHDPETGTNVVGHYVHERDEDELREPVTTDTE